MQLRTFTAPNLVQAQSLVRQALGEDAVLVSTSTDKDTGEIHIVAVDDQAQKDPRLGQMPLAPVERTNCIIEALISQGVPLSLAGRIAEGAERMEPEEPLAALAGILDMDFAYDPIDIMADNQRLMFVGPPGSGKTLALVKVAAQAAMQGLSCKIFTTDMAQAGAVEQLAAFAKILRLEVLIAEDAEELAEYLARVPSRTLVLIDTAGANPHDDAEIDALDSFAKAAPVEPVLVLNAGMDALEAADCALAFGAVGARRLIATRIDAARRRGSILAGLEAGSLAFAGFSQSREAAQGLIDGGPAQLASLYFDGADQIDFDFVLRHRKSPKHTQTNADMDEADAAHALTLEDHVLPDISGDETAEETMSREDMKRRMAEVLDMGLPN